LLEGLGHFFDRPYRGNDFPAVIEPVTGWMARHTQTRSLT
jgi:hypothetical protein